MVLSTPSRSVIKRNQASLSPVFVGGWGRGWVAGCFVALSLLFAVVTKGNACYL